MAAKHELTDEQLLGVLRARQEGQSARAIGERLGRSRASICGLWFRIDQDSAAEELRPLRPGELGYGQGPVVKPENMDGGMPDRWWLAGLRRQARQGRRA